MIGKLIAENRRARFDYFLEETFEAGLIADRHRGEGAARGPRQYRRVLRRRDGREITLVNAHIPEYGPANRFNHEPRRPRKLLLHRKEIDRLIGAAQREGRTLVPTRLYFNDTGLVKLEVALATRQEGPRQAPGRGRPRLEARAGPADARSEAERGFRTLGAGSLVCCRRKKNGGGGGAVLEGVKVVEVSTWVAGRQARPGHGRRGADVIKIEGRDGDPVLQPLRRCAATGRPDPVFELENRGKRGVVLDIGKG